MSTQKKISGLLVPLISAGTFFGAIQDIASPLVKIGPWVGLVFLIAAATLLLCGENSKVGNFIQRTSGYWKKPFIVSLCVLGIATLIFSFFTTKSVINGGKGVLADNVKVIAAIQKSILGLEKSVKELKAITTDTKKTVEDSAIVINNTHKDVETILEHTKMTANKVLLEKGYSISRHEDFFRAVDELDDQNLIEILKLFKSANFSLNRKINVYPYLFSDNNERNNALLRMPRYANVVHGLVYSQYPIHKIKSIFNVFKESEKSITPVADWYAWQSINPAFSNFRGVKVLHPQMILGSNESSFDKSLISYPRARNNISSPKRGGYTLMHTAAALGDIELVTLLIQRGHDLNELTVSGYTPLALAIENEHIEVVNFLLQEGADVSTNGYLAFEVAVLKMIDGYFPLSGSSKPLHDKTKLFGTPKDNPYFQIAKTIRKKLSKVPSEILDSTLSLYSKQVTFFQKELEEYGNYPGTIMDKKYKNKIALGKEYINALKSL